METVLVDDIVGLGDVRVGEPSSGNFGDSSGRLSGSFRWCNDVLLHEVRQDVGEDRWSTGDLVDCVRSGIAVDAECKVVLVSTVAESEGGSSSSTGGGCLQSIPCTHNAAITKRARHIKVVVRTRIKSGDGGVRVACDETGAGGVVVGVGVGDGVAGHDGLACIPEAASTRRAQLGLPEDTDEDGKKRRKKPKKGRGKSKGKCQRAPHQLTVQIELIHRAKGMESIQNRAHDV